MTSPLMLAPSSWEPSRQRLLPRFALWWVRLHPARSLGSAPVLRSSHYPARGGGAGVRCIRGPVVPITRSERMVWKYPSIGTVCEEAVGSPSNRGGTMTTLMDTVRIEAPSRSPVRAASPLDPSWDDGSEIPSSERSVQDRSRSTQWDRLAMGRGQSLWSEAA